jgi:ABC-type branched-subunit amino acid transport system substrate-binding protein
MNTPSPSVTRRRLTARLTAPLACLIIAATTLLAGCPSTTADVNAPLSGRSALLDALPPVEAALAAGRWDDAAAQAQALAARFPNDPCLGAAHLLHGRALLGARAFGEAQAALRVSQTLGCEPDPLVARAAALYGALTALRRGGVTPGLAALAAQDIIPPGRWLPAADASPLWWLTAERHLLADPAAVRPALHALGLALTAADPQDLAFTAHIRARAWDIAADAPAASLLDALSASSPLSPPSPSSPTLAWAIAAYTLALRALTHDPDAGLAAPDPATLLAIAEPALIACGEAPRAALLRQLLGQPPSLAMTSGPILIGAVLPLSGPNRKVGRMVMAGLLLAQGAFSPSDSSSSLRLIFEDDASQPQRASDAVRKLAAAGAIAILGPLDADAAAAAASTAATLSIPLLTFSYAPPSPASPASAAPASPYVTRFAPSPLSEARTLAQHLVSLTPADAPEPPKVLILHPDLPYGEGMTDAFTQALLSLSPAAAITSRAYPPDATDLRKLAQEVAKLPLDAVFIPDTAERAERVASFLAQENIWSRQEGQGAAGGRGDGRRFVWLLGTSLWYQDDLSTLRQLEGAVFPVAYAATEPGEENQAFVSAFQKVYGRAPGLLDALGFDAMGWLRSGLEAGAVGREGIKDVWAKRGSAYEGVTGSLRVEGGEVSPGFRLVRVKGAKPTFLVPLPPTWTP